MSGHCTALNLLALSFIYLIVWRNDVESRILTSVVAAGRPRLPSETTLAATENMSAATSAGPQFPGADVNQPP